MKTLVLLLFIPLISFGQTFDYNDLKVINSETQFKRFSFENEFVKTRETDFSLTYAHTWDKESDEAVIWSYYYPDGTFHFQLVKKTDGSSHHSFNRVLEQVKNKCTFYDIKEDGFGSSKREFICYTCPGSVFPGKIGFARGDTSDFIETFTDFN